ncbi:LOG family protein [Arthrobacter sp. JSM 101049]|uniref:LOG family protein n=1 Tax=Arthrobacter sp. JSM 101049 TaxID=929097 RepID=UPI0035661883
MDTSPALQPSPRELDIDTLAEFDARTAPDSVRMAGWHLQSLDLADRRAVLDRVDVSGAVFLGCELPAGTIDGLRGRGALIFPELPGLPFDPYRGGLYTAAELYAGLGDDAYEHTPDALVYAWTRRDDAGRSGLDAALATTLHDHAIGAALAQLLAAGPGSGTSGVPGASGAPCPGHDGDAPTVRIPGRGVVGVMGGHAAGRGSATFTAAARLGRDLARAGFTVATGGGPGAMEAANLGAYLSAAGAPALQEAVAALEATPSFRPSVSRWARAALAVLARHPQGTPTLGIPTWFYGHEPPNLFATHIAKYFANSIREDVLLSVCDAGLVVLPGAAGTVQEIFQDACENYYGTAQTQTPMVLVGRRHWTRELPAWPLLQSLARGREMAGAIHLVDSVEEAVAILAR